MEVPISCEQCEALLPGYALTALEADEAAVVAEHLNTCDRCPDSLRAYRAVVDRMAEAVPAQSAAPEIWQHLRETLNDEHLASVPSPVTSRFWWQREKAPRWVFGLATIQILLLLGTAWLAWTSWSRSPVLVVPSAWKTIQQQLNIHRQMMVLLTAPEARRVILHSDVPHVQGILLLQPAETVAALVALDFPPLRPDRVYQLWLLRDNQRDNGGTFQVDQDGYAMVTVTAPQPLSAYQAAGITEEPAGGSLRPTSPRLAGSPL